MGEGEVWGWPNGLGERSPLAHYGDGLSSFRSTRFARLGSAKQSFAWGTFGYASL